MGRTLNQLMPSLEEIGFKKGVKSGKEPLLIVYGNEIAFRVPWKDDRAFLPPTSFVTVYKAHLRSRLRLPISDELMSIFRALQVPIAQFHANAISVSEFWPLPKEWGQVPEVYTRVPSEVETASLTWLVKFIEDNLGDFRRDHLVSRVEAKKAKWGPPSLVQKLKIPLPKVL
ncbi:hypothetical protein Nepgr_022371 [Nepenthes gracilis]|uniref:Uncharacterized protein n=1 Tax=Nepenthes gracilis TaxID=150966 RepID=A0AAD3T0M6_NEPGR|nr:hypothetical protein Nepgr_022371 [Nepenthes gracilis]